MAATQFVTDGGLETDLIFHRGFDLPDFAAFPLLDDERGRAALADYYAGYAAIAAAHGVGLQLETPTWRANPDWGARLGHDAAALAAVNSAAVGFLRDVAGEWSDRIPEIRVSGQIGPRGDGYVPGAAVDPDDAAAYHQPQVSALADAGADLVSALTLTDVGEAVGVVRAARQAGVAVLVSFTVETDGLLPTGLTLAQAIAATDEAAPPDSFMVNCAHPDHVARGVTGDGPWDRVHGLRVNASDLTHEELDAMTELDDGDPDVLASAHARLEAPPRGRDDRRRLLRHRHETRRGDLAGPAYASAVTQPLTPTRRLHLRQSGDVRIRRPHRRVGPPDLSGGYPIWCSLGGSVKMVRLLRPGCRGAPILDY